MKNYLEKMLSYAARFESLGIDTDHISEEDLSLFAALHDLDVTDTEFVQDWLVFAIDEELKKII